MKVRVPIANSPGKAAQLETDATVGSTFGVDFRWPDGALVTPQQIADMVGELARPSDDPNAGSTLWRALAEVPENVDAIASLAAEGLVRRAANGGWTAAALSSNDLPDLPDTGGGTLRKIARDAKGRVAGTSDATTDDLAEGTANLYHTNERARAAARTISRTASGALGGHRLVRSLGASLVGYVDVETAGHGDDTLGVTTGAAADGDAVTVQTAGPIEFNGWAWTPGAPVFASTDGLLSQSPPATGFIQQVGHAESPTVLFLAVEAAIYQEA